ncbi:hypothetical protein EVAR_11204_1 [Eumeta japonica]|uniref:Uncharacterized protein n=1 Tax=Eumeta variegata TaxID=151549 RepID=A0A4C1U461_EUMVA|nr:hypothetical protein EVAR_11204_1 [Eumeta japonica]
MTRAGVAVLLQFYRTSRAVAAQEVLHQTKQSVIKRISDAGFGCGWSHFESVTLGNVTMSHRTREALRQLRRASPGN